MITKAFAWLIAYILPGCLLLGGLAGLWVSTRYLVDAYASSAWPHANGTIIRSELGSESGSVRIDDSTRYWPEIEFEYDVDGTTYRSSNVTLDGLRSGTHIGTGKKQAEEVLSRYPLDARIDVRYNPNAPGRAVLQTGVTPRNFLVPAFALVLTVLGSVWLWLMFTSRTGNDEQWHGKDRVCPQCQTTFTSVQDKGVCPNCQHVFFASDVMDLEERPRS